MSEKILVIRAENGEVTKEEIEDGNIEEVVKKYATIALKEWDPSYSDFIVMKDKYEVRLKLPISPEQFKRFSKFSLRREEGFAVFDIPLYVISFDNVWVEGDYLDRKMYLVSVYVDNKVKRDLEVIARENTSPRRETRRITLEIGEEELAELEELEGSKPSRRRRR